MIKRPAALILSLLLLCHISSVVLAGSAGEADYQAGLRAVNAGNPEEAIRLFSRAIQSDPSDHRYYNDRGVAYKRSGNLEQALVDFNRSLEIKPDYPSALNNRGLVYVQQGKFDSAIEDFERAARQGTFKAKIFTNMGLAHAGKGDHQRAIKDLQTALTFRPVDPRAFLFLATSLEQLGNEEKALKMYQLARGLMHDAATEDFVEKRIVALEKSLPQSTPPPVRSAESSERVKRGGQRAPAAGHAPEKQLARKREIVPSKPVSPAARTVGTREAKVTEPSPETIEALNRICLAKAVETLRSPADEIFRQGLEFLGRGDSRKALVRFEDTLQLEKRRKNLRGAAWSMLEIGRTYMRIGDQLKGWAHLDSALRLFKSSKAADETILVLIEMAGVKKASNRPDAASSLLLEAARIATASGNQRLASALGDIAAGKAPLAETRRVATGTVRNADSRSERSKASRDIQPVPRGASYVGKHADRSSMDQRKPSPGADRGQKPARNTNNVFAKTGRLDSIGRGPLTWGREQQTSRMQSAAALRRARKAGTHEDARTEKKEEPQPERTVMWAPGSKPDKPTHVEAGVGKATTGVPQSPAMAKSGGPEIKSAKKDAERKASRSLNQDLADLRKYKESNDERNMIPLLDRLSKRYLAGGQYEKALHGLVASLALREKLRSEEGAEILYILRGNIRLKLGDRPMALEDFTRARALLEARGKSQEASEVESKCRALAEALRLEPSATLRALQDLWKARLSGDQRGETFTLYRLARLYEQAGNHVQALNYYERSAASLLAEKAGIYKKMGNDHLAKRSYAVALEAFKNLDYSRYLTMLREPDLSDALGRHSRKSP